MGERLDYVKIDPTVVMDLGCGTGADLAWLAQRYPKALRVGCDLSRAMLAEAGPGGGWLRHWLPGNAAALRVCADARQLPIGSATVDLLWSNLMLQWLADPRAAIVEANRLMRAEGLLMFSTFGPDTLKELRQAFRAADDGPHVLPFMDMHDIGDALVGGGFAEPVMDMEVLTLTYADGVELIRDLRNNASGNALACRRRGLTGRRRWQAMLSALNAQRCDGRLGVSFEVVYGHAWKVAPKTTAQGHAVMRFSPPGQRF